jgi:hypothetical protein
MLRRPAAAVTSVGMGRGVLRYKLILDGVSKGRGHNGLPNATQRPPPTAGLQDTAQRPLSAVSRDHLDGEQRFFYVAMLLPPRFRYPEVRRAAEVWLSCASRCHSALGGPLAREMRQ